MRHGDKVNNLGRTKSHRVALLKNLSISLIIHKRINTTLAKAKSLRGHLEPLITKSKLNTTHSRRVVFGYLQNKEAIKELFDVIAAKVGDRPGGYLRIIRTGNRKGDNAEMSMIEFVDYNDVMLELKQAASKKTRRSRRGGKKNYSDDVTNLANAKAEEAKMAKAAADAEARAAEEEAKAAAEAELKAAEDARLAAEAAAIEVVSEPVAVVEETQPDIVVEIPIEVEPEVIAETIVEPETIVETVVETETIIQMEQGHDPEFDNIDETTNDETEA